MKKLISTVLIVCLIFCLTACGSSASSAEAGGASSVSASASSELAAVDSSESQESKIVMPTIAGSNAYDVTVSLEQAGLPKATRSDTLGGYIFAASDGAYTYEIYCNENYEIAFMECCALNIDDGFLGFCASFPRDDGNAQAAMDWVNQNVGGNAETKMGDVTFILAAAENGTAKTLTVQTDGWDAYLDAALDAALGLN